MKHKYLNQITRGLEVVLKSRKDAQSRILQYALRAQERIIFPTDQFGIQD